MRLKRRRAANIAPQDRRRVLLTLLLNARGVAPEEENAGDKPFLATKRPLAYPMVAPYDSRPLNSVFFERYGEEVLVEQGSRSSSSSSSSSSFGTNGERTAAGSSSPSSSSSTSTVQELLDAEKNRKPILKYSPNFINLQELPIGEDPKFGKNFNTDNYKIRPADINVPLPEAMLEEKNVPLPEQQVEQLPTPLASTLQPSENSENNYDSKTTSTIQTTTSNIAPLNGPSVKLASPPMGWMSWENFRCQRDCETHPDDCVSEKQYKEMADTMVRDGYVKAGYNILWIDDCWMAGRGPNKEFLPVPKSDEDRIKHAENYMVFNKQVKQSHDFGPNRDAKTGASLLARNPDTQELIPDPLRFPSGMKALGEYFQSKGIKFGLYTCAGTLSCEQDAGSMYYEDLDMQTFHDWGVKYVKVDGCFVPQGKVQSQYKKIGHALQNKDIVYACSWPAYLDKPEAEKPFSEMYHEAGCNMWRNFGDISNSFPVLRSIISHWASQTQGLESAPLGAFNDPDMMLAGSDHDPGEDNAGFTYTHGSQYRLTVDQARIQFAIWAIVAAPLLLSADLRKLAGDEGKPYRDLILNPKMIAVNQDPNGVRGGCRAGCDTDLQLWARDLTDGSVAIALVNLSPSAIPHYQFGTNLKKPVKSVNDVWQQKGYEAEYEEELPVEQKLPGGQQGRNNIPVSQETISAAAPVLPAKTSVIGDGDQWRINVRIATKQVDEELVEHTAADITFQNLAPQSTLFLVLQASAEPVKVVRSSPVVVPPPPTIAAPPVTPAVAQGQQQVPVKEHQQVNAAQQTTPTTSGSDRVMVKREEDEDDAPVGGGPPPWELAQMQHEKVHEEALARESPIRADGQKETVPLPHPNLVNLASNRRQGKTDLATTIAFVVQLIFLITGIVLFLSCLNRWRKNWQLTMQQNRTGLNNSVRPARHNSDGTRSPIEDGRSGSSHSLHGPLSTRKIVYDSEKQSSSSGTEDEDMKAKRPFLHYPEPLDHRREVDLEQGGALFSDYSSDSDEDDEQSYSL
ncbi:unnamed protein product [Amoebophrya sp. A120]|nr:unnamed protein product [Amoebophrya sp. A120]|eukprot:GSA120T00017841001.1